jgi:hypothetical protein
MWQFFLAASRLITTAARRAAGDKVKENLILWSFPRRLSRCDGKRSSAGGNGLGCIVLYIRKGYDKYICWKGTGTSILTSALIDHSFVF